MEIYNMKRAIALIEELETSISLIKYGLREIQSIRNNKVFYHLLMLTLASGFERLMKVIILLYKTEKDASYPKECPWDINNGHNLTVLKKFILKECFSEKYLACSGVANTDLDFLKNDQRLNEFVNIISNFGKSARYYNLDLYIGKTVKTLSPEREWKKLEKLIIEEQPEQKRKILLDNNINMDAYYKIITKEIVIKFERLARALSRLFTLGGMSEKAKQLSPIVSDFIELRDKDLGEKRY